MASTLGKLLLDENLVDIIICFAPSVIVAEDFRTELEGQIGERFDGLLGSRGRTLTYQGMLSLTDRFWDIFQRLRVFVIFDEIHHCAGFSQETANAWGEKIIDRVQGKAAYTLALTGTPWRSDSVPIVLSRYCANSGVINCDYQYGLARAIKEGVCRTPRLTVVDNDQIVVHRGKDQEHFTTIRDLLAASECGYHQLLETETLVTYLLKQASQTLATLRKSYPDAGGLIVAASVAHANFIAEILYRELGEIAAVATYKEDDPLTIIRRYKEGGEKWIISVGMVSEGTNVPRLRVCCHLTRVKTELYFRQILGRILRANGKGGEEGFLYMPAEPNLMEFAQRLAEDIPGAAFVKFEMMSSTNKEHRLTPGQRTSKSSPSGLTVRLGLMNSQRRTVSLDNTSPASSSLQQSYESSLSMFGRFRRELLAISGLDIE